MEEDKIIHTMKLSSFTISALLLAQIQAGAQTQTQKPAKVKPKTKEAVKPKEPVKPTEKPVLAADSVKPLNKSRDHYYCPPCGRG